MLDINWINSKDDWKELKSIFAITRTVTAQGKCSMETCYYISSLDSSADELMKIAREHRKIESTHWLLDVVFPEDSCDFESENAHKTLNIFRKLALLIHKRFIATLSKKPSIKGNMLGRLINSDLLFDLLQNL